MTTWQKSKASKSQTQYYALNTDINLRNLFLNTLKWTSLNKQPDLKKHPISAFFSFAEYCTALL